MWRVAWMDVIGRVAKCVLPQGQTHFHTFVDGTKRQMKMRQMHLASCCRQTHPHRRPNAGTTVSSCSSASFSLGLAADGGGLLAS